MRNWRPDVTRDQPAVSSQITFLYYHSLEAPQRFYGETLGLELVEDQNWAKIYRVAGSAFVGIVTGDDAFKQPQVENAVLLTLVVDDLDAWYAHLKDADVHFLTDIREMEGIQVRAFFVQDPGGYAVEVQQFLNPDVAELFE